ncbi:hypothetical protein Tco_0364403 [Tanacetum coccineum]
MVVTMERWCRGDDVDLVVRVAVKMMVTMVLWWWRGDDDEPVGGDDVDDGNGDVGRLGCDGDDRSGGGGGFVFGCYLEDIVDLEDKLSSHDRIVYKMGQSIQTIHMIGKRPNKVYDPFLKAGLGYQNSKRLKKAIAAQPKMYDGERLHITKLIIDSPDSEETLKDAIISYRPPMLDRTDFASWQQRIRLYCQGKENGVNILKSIDEGPFQMGTFQETLAEGNKGALNLGLPKDIYTLINHYTDPKDIWDNVKMLLEGSELTKEDRESQLYDDFEHFRQNKGETIHDYYVRFAKLINDIWFWKESLRS